MHIIRRHSLTRRSTGRPSGEHRQFSLRLLGTALLACLCLAPGFAVASQAHPPQPTPAGEEILPAVVPNSSEAMQVSYIHSARWDPTSRGWTLRVTPTAFARAAGILGLPQSYRAGVDGWKELYAKYKDRGLNTNLGGMRDQYICHQQIAYAKRTWNLDEWRPDVSYSATVRAGCNPGGGPD
jgi:Protein of unknown function (DUF2599)